MPRCLDVGGYNHVVDAGHHAGHHAGHASPLPGTMVVTHHQCAGDVQHEDPAYGPSSALTSSTPPATAVLAESPSNRATASSPKAALAASEACHFLTSYTLPSLASYPTGEYSITPITSITNTTINNSPLISFVSLHFPQFIQRVR